MTSAHRQTDRVTSRDKGRFALVSFMLAINNVRMKFCPTVRRHLQPQMERTGILHTFPRVSRLDLPGGKEERAS